MKIAFKQKQNFKE